MDGREAAGAARSAAPSWRPRLPLLVRDQLAAFLELLALAGLVVAAPLLVALGRSPDLLLYRQADREDVALLAVALVLVPR